MILDKGRTGSMTRGVRGLCQKGLGSLLRGINLTGDE